MILEQNNEASLRSIQLANQAGGYPKQGTTSTGNPKGPDAKPSERSPKGWTFRATVRYQHRTDPTRYAVDVPDEIDSQMRRALTGDDKSEWETTRLARVNVDRTRDYTEEPVRDAAPTRR